MKAKANENEYLVSFRIQSSTKHNESSQYKMNET